MEYYTEDFCLAFLSRAKKAYRVVLDHFGVPIAGSEFSNSQQSTFVKEHHLTISVATIAFNRIELLKENEKEFCHQCKRPKLRADLAICSTCTGSTPRKYCEACLWNRHAIRLIDCLRNRKWVCLFCSGLCNCAICLRIRGLDPYDPEALKFDQLQSSVQTLEEVAVGYVSSQLTGRTDRRPRPVVKPRKSFKQKSREILPLRLSEQASFLRQPQQPQQEAKPLENKSLQSSIVSQLKP